MKTGIRAAVLAVSATLAACGGGTPEDEIKASIAAMEAAVEAKQPGDFLEHVAVDFSGNGQLDRSQLRGFLTAQMLRAENISVVLTPASVKLHTPGVATVEVSALVTGGSFLPSEGRGLAIKSGWRLEDGEWKCYTASWE